MLVTFPILNKKDKVLGETSEVGALVTFVVAAAVIKHYNQRQLKEEWVYFGIWFQRDESIMARVVASCGSHWQQRES